MTILYRGSDLATMSSTEGSGTGASLQGDEQDIIQADHVDLVEETLERNVTPFVIRYRLGTDDIKARFSLIRPDGKNQKLQLETDDKLISWGCPVAKNDLLERYGRPQPDPKEDLASPARAPVLQPALNSHLVNEAVSGRLLHVENLADRVFDRLRLASRDALAQAMAHDLAPLRGRIEAALANQDDAAMRSMLAATVTDMPSILEYIARSPEAQAVLEDSQAAALINGIAEAATARSPAIDIQPEAKP
jgi:hypothetical protein